MYVINLSFVFNPGCFINENTIAETLGHVLWFSVAGLQLYFLAAFNHSWNAEIAYWHAGINSVICIFMARGSLI